MKHSIHFGAVFFATNLLFVVLLIHKQSQYTHKLYAYQKDLTIQEKLTQQKQLLTNQLYTLQSPALLKKRAIEELHFSHLSLTSIKKVSLT